MKLAGMMCAALMLCAALMCGTVAVAGTGRMLVEDFDRTGEPSPWDTGEQMIGRHGWQGLRYYGETFDPASISLDGQGHSSTKGGRTGGAAIALPAGPYSSGVVTATVRVSNVNHQAAGKSRLFLGTRNLLANEGVSTRSDALWTVLDNGPAQNTTCVYSDALSDVEVVLAGPLPFGVSEVEMQVDLDQLTGHIGYYLLNNQGLRASDLNILARFDGVLLAEIAAFGFATDECAVPTVIDDVYVSHEVPEPLCAMAVIVGGGLVLLNRDRIGWASSARSIRGH
jgi:hypothetical protein